MRMPNELWRVATSMYRTKKIGDIGTTVKSYHEHGEERFVTWNVYTDKHYYTISLTEEQLRDAVAFFDKKKEIA